MKKAKKRVYTPAEERRVVLFLKLIDFLPNNPADLKLLAKEAKVSVSTLDNWRSGRTITPHLATAYRVIHALGLDLRITKAGRITKYRQRKAV